VPVSLPAHAAQVGPFTAIATPGHSADSVCLLFGDVCFTGDTVLGSGSVFIAPGEGSLSEYLASLRRLRELDLSVLCPGHGPYVRDPAAKLDEYIAHRLDRERRLLEALDAGLRRRDDLLDAAWPEVSAELRPAAALTLAAHLEKLSEEGRLPNDAG
jgi:glyoxylase-like metal-dependent hydrolase (beta-lactamase superfamily II)